MNSISYYTTTGAVFDYLVEINQKSGAEPTFPMAVESMRSRGLLQTSPPPLPPFHSNMGREEFRDFILALPIPADLFLAQTSAFLSSRTIYEPNLFPAGKDVFCFLNMPYMDRKLHFHDFFEITYVVEGSCTFLFEGESASLGIGDICITSPMAAHSLPLEPGCTALSVVVRKSTFNSLFPNLLSSQNLVSLFFRNSLYERRRANYILIRTGNDQELFQTVQMLACESNRADDFSNPCGISLLNLFLARALRAGAEVSLHHYENYSERDFDFTLILLYIQQNYRTVTLASLAETFHFSETYLSKLIHKNMNRSFTDVLRSLKMERAMDFLMNTPMKVSEIAAAVGYDSVDHFSRTFRRMYGASPQQYKQAHQKTRVAEQKQERAVMKRTEVNIRDPFILTHDGKYYLYGTRSATCWGPADGLDCYVGDDLENWEGPIEIFHRPEGFFADREYWAPECIYHNGAFYLVTTFGAPDRKKGIYVLKSGSPTGPFEPYGERLTPEDWACIDGTVYFEGETPYLIFSHSFEDSPDGDMCMVRLRSDLSGAEGQYSKLFSAAEAPWARPVPFAKAEFGMDGDVYFTDGPYVVRLDDGRLYMTWSSWGERGYAVGAAVSDSGSVRGPWRQENVPIFPVNGGHGMMFRDLEGRLTFTLHFPNDKYKERPVFRRVLTDGNGLRLED